MRTKLFLLVVMLLTFSQCKQVRHTSPENSLKLTNTNEKLYPTPTIVEYPVNSISTSSKAQGSSSNNVSDDNTTTFWSSAASSSNHAEWIIFSFDGSKAVNYIKLTPRFDHGPALGFPVTFTVCFSIGGSWKSIYTYTDFPTPTNIGGHSLPVILPLPAANINGVQIKASILGKNEQNSYAFQLSEVGAGYNSGFEHFNFEGNDGSLLVNRIDNAGSGSFDPNKTLNFTEDERYPLILPLSGSKNKNIYAPSIVNVDGTTWNIYFGGWDVNSKNQNDDIYFTVSHDDFLSFDTHARMIAHNGNTIPHVNNPSVLKLSPNSWLMYYTQKAEPGYNKPAYATSANGATWIPYKANGSNYLQMANYNNWATTDVNGSNVLFLDNTGTRHLFFTDFNIPPKTPYKVHHATSNNNISYSYVGDVNSTDSQICTDIKSFKANGVTYYYAVSHLNAYFIKFNLTTDLFKWPASSQMFTNFSTADKYITSVGIVAANNRMYGVLYGAGPDVNLNQNSIYALWLTKKITFISDETGNTWGGNGNAERSHGPNQVVMPMSNSFTTGHYNVYDTDGRTLLFSSPQVTIRSGDVWRFIP